MMSVKSERANAEVAELRAEVEELHAKLQQAQQVC